MIIVILMTLNKEIQEQFIDRFSKCLNDVYFIIYNEINIDIIKEINPIGIILSGSEARVLDNNSPTIPNELFDLNIPILGICYGYQYLIKHFVGSDAIQKNNKRIFEICQMDIKHPFYLPELKYKLNYHDSIIKIPDNSETIICNTGILHNINEYVGFYNTDKKIMGVIFHPEVYEICGTLFFNNWINFISS